MEVKDISYFDLSLRAFLREYHPDLVNSVNFVSSRAEEAELVYNNRMRENGNSILALEDANQVLFAGLNFSKFSFLKDILENEFFLEVQKDDIEEMGLHYFDNKEVQGIFNNYALTDDFEDDEERYQSLYNEITGIIHLQIEKANGV